jgi:hypothetical protein
MTNWWARGQLAQTNFSTRFNSINFWKLSGENPITPLSQSSGHCRTFSRMRHCSACAQSHNDRLKLEEVVVIGTPTGASQMPQSSPVSTVGMEQILLNPPTNASDSLHCIRSIRAESSGGSGNANATVRDGPISACASRSAQFQKDGLPVMLLGDISLSTPNRFLLAVAYWSVCKWCAQFGLVPCDHAPTGMLNFIRNEERH